jgi:hypothetical protein
MHNTDRIFIKRFKMYFIYFYDEGIGYSWFHKKRELSEKI